MEKLKEQVKLLKEEIATYCDKCIFHKAKRKMKRQRDNWKRIALEYKSRCEECNKPQGGQQ